MFEYFCAEACRQCGRLIPYCNDKPGRMPQTACRSCWDELVCAGDSLLIENCGAAAHGLLVASACPYAGVMKKLIYRFKYNDDALVLHDLVTLLLPAWNALFEIIVKERSLSDSTDDSSVLQIIFMPVPLHWWRQLRRGFNQSESLAIALAKQFAVRQKNSARIAVAVDNRVLQRKRMTTAQHGLGKRERRRNVHDAFSARSCRSDRIGKSVVVLIDDIYTSGATIAECAVALRLAGWTSVYALTVARAMLNE